MKLSIISAAYHRNGICGAPFQVAIFEDDGPEAGRKVGIIFDEPHHCAVLDLQKLVQGDITCGTNSWRGDNYEPQLRQIIADRSGDAGMVPVRFDAYEIHGVRAFGRGKNRCYEQVPDNEAQFFSLYGHIPGHGVDCIGDFKTRDHAEEMYARITGKPYAATAAKEV